MRYFLKLVLMLIPYTIGCLVGNGILSDVHKLILCATAGFSWAMLYEYAINYNVRL